MNPFTYLKQKLGGKPATPAPMATATTSTTPPAKVNPMLQFISPAAQPRWMGPGVAFYTPQRIEQIFRQAMSGDLQSEWEMFDLMEATAPRIAKNLNQLKDDVISSEIKVQPFKVQNEEASDEAKRRAALVEEILWSMEPNRAKDENDLEDTMRDVLDARGKGHAVLEISWDWRDISTGLVFAPRCTRWVHPAWYGYEHGSGDADLKLKVGSDSTFAGRSTYQEFPEHKFIIGVCKNKTGHPLGSALLHTLGFWWGAANFSAEWFLNLGQITGVPFRWATYDPNLTPGDQATLANMLANMGSQAWAMFPQGTQMEFKEAIKAAGDYPQMAILNFFDKLCDLVILRQTLSSDVSEKGGSRAQGEVHERILGSVEMACAKWTCKTLQPLVRSICELNFGDLRECPYLAPPIAEEDESEELATTLKTCADAGLEPTDEALPEISTRLGFEVRRKQVTPGEGTGPTTENATQLAAKEAIIRRIETDHVNQLAAKHAPAVGAALRKNFEGALQIIKESGSSEECQAKLKVYFADWRPGELVRAIEPALQECAAHGADEGATTQK